MPRRRWRRGRRAYNRQPNRRNDRNPSPDSPSSGSQTSGTNTETTPDNASSSASATSHTNIETTPDNASPLASATSTTPDSRPRHATIPSPYHGNASQATDARGEPVAELNNDVFEDGPRAPRDAAEMKWYSPLFTSGLSGVADTQAACEAFMWRAMRSSEQASREEEEDCNFWE